MQLYYRKFVRLISSRWFFVATIVLFAGQTVWLATTSRFPMPFDEAYHLGIIQFFTHHLSPLVTSQDSSTYQYGALVQGTSQLYHYLMSFPYRLVAFFTSSLVAQVVVLRLCNVALALCSLVVARKVLRQLRVPAAVTNLAVFLFAFTPIVSTVSAQISYDDLFLLLIMLALLLTVRFMKRLDENGALDIQSLLLLVVVCCAGSLVKYAFLPIFAAITAVVIYKLIRHRERIKPSLFGAAVSSFSKLHAAVKYTLLASLLLVGFLFCQVYAVNIVRYHTPVPQCDQVLGTKACLHYYAWADNYHSREQYQQHPYATRGPLYFIAYWLLYVNLFTYGSVMPLVGFINIPPVFLMALLLLSLVASLAVFVGRKKLWRNHHYLFVVLGICLAYILVLWVRNYHDYIWLGVPNAVTGRYLIPMLPFSYALAGLGMWYALTGNQKIKQFAKFWLVVVCVGLFLVFGGFVQYVTTVPGTYGRLGRGNSFDLVLR